MKRFIWGLIICFVLSSLLAPTPTYATTLNPGCATADLIAAINTANTDERATVINLPVGCVYTLTAANNISNGANGLPLISSDNLTINGNGATIKRAPGAPPFRIFQLTRRVKLTLINLTINNGQADGSDLAGSGGGILSVDDGNRLDLVGVTLSENRASGLGYMAGGGAIAFQGIGSRLGVRQSSFANNSTDSGGGGALLVQSDNAPVEIDMTSYARNRAPNGNGGAVLIFSADHVPVTITRTTFAGNIAKNGGAIFSGFNSILVLHSSLVTGNSAGYGGGGVATLGATGVDVINSTFVENIAAAPYGYGGAIFNARTSFMITSSTIANNSAYTWGGGLLNGEAGVLTLQNSIVAGNESGENCGGPIIRRGDNLQFGDASCGSDVRVADPRLGPLANHGGPTQTMPLLPGSPAIGAGDAASCPPTDQRGIPRPQDGGCDIGAFEASTALVINPTMVFAGDPGFTLVVIGNGFKPGDRLMWNGAVLPTTFVDSATLRATIADSQIAVPEEIMITVTGSSLRGATLRVVPLVSRIYMPMVER